MHRQSPVSLFLAASLGILGLACDAAEPGPDQELELGAEQPVLVDAVELSAQLAADPSTRVVIDLPASPAGYVLDQSEAPMPFEALLWFDGSTLEPVDFLTMSAERGIELDDPIMMIRPYIDTEGFRQACGTFPEKQEDLYCSEDEWGWVCCSEPGGL